MTGTDDPRARGLGLHDHERHHAEEAFDAERSAADLRVI